MDLFIDLKQVVISDLFEEYRATHADFVLDYGGDVPNIGFYINARYRQAEYTKYSTGTGEVTTNGSWPAGDNVINDLASLQVARELRENPPVELVEFRSEVASAALKEGEDRVYAAESNPTIGVIVTDTRKVIKDKKRDAKAKKKVSAISDADDHLFDHIDLVMDTVDLILDDVEAAVDIPALEIIRDSIPSDGRWPAWVPI